jgi:hypothetical protein
LAEELFGEKISEGLFFFEGFVTVTPRKMKRGDGSRVSFIISKQF